MGSLQGDPEVLGAPALHAGWGGSWRALLQLWAHPRVSIMSSVYSMAEPHVITGLMATSRIAGHYRESHVLGGDRGPRLRDLTPTSTTSDRLRRRFT
jgi:hypothetical protein